ncbi:MAG: hypothetical protein ABIR04_13390 [Cypionkella sp.]
MRQLLLATALIALPVAAFTGYNVYSARAAVTANVPAASLGDLSAFRAIITDVQFITAKGDFAVAKARIKDFEIAWDDNETGLKPMDPAHWGLIDEAADGAFTAVRAGSPDSASISEVLITLQAALEDQSPVTK